MEGSASRPGSAPLRGRSSEGGGPRAGGDTVRAPSGPARRRVAPNLRRRYGSRGDEILHEGSDSGRDFLAEVGRLWEDAAGPAEAAGIRTVRARIGVVLSARGGMLERILPVYRMGLGGALGNGTQWMSWITLDDLVGILHHMIFDEALSGPVNAVAPRPLRQAEFARVLGRALRRPTLARVPAAVVRALAGEMGEALVLGGARVEPRRLLEAGFRHRHPDLEEALRMEIGSSNARMGEDQ